MSASVTKQRSPFKATKLWNQLLNSFKEGMELKRKRYRLKSYQQCFSGADALEWLHKYLQNHSSFGEHVTREQAFMLLQKFLDNNVFQSVVGKTSKRFQDTSCLYKFVAENTDGSKEGSGGGGRRGKVPSQKSLTNLLKNAGKRNSRSDELDGFCELQKVSGDKENQDMLNKPVVGKAVVGADSQDTDSSLACYTNSASMFDPAEEDDLDVHNSSISQHFNRSSSLRVKKTSTLYPGGETSSRTVWVKRGEEKPNVKTSVQKKNDKRGTSKKKTLPVHSAASVLSHSAKRQLNEFSSSASPPKKSKNNDHDTKIAEKKGVMTGLLPRKAVNVLGEKPCYINQVSSYNTYNVSAPGLSTASENVSKSKSKKSSSTKKKSTFQKTFSKSFLDLTRLYEKSSEPLGHKNVPSTATIRKSESFPLPLQQFSQKSFSPHAMRRRSMSQNSILNMKSRSVYNINDKYTNEPPADNFSYFSKDKSKKYLYKAASTWTLDTVGLSQKNEVDTERSGEAEVTAMELDEIWRSVALLSLRKILNVERIGDYVDCDSVHGNVVMRNMECNNSELSSDAPDWLISAMNCLEEWPKQSVNNPDSVGVELPKYPGFERDVYRAVKEHYHSTLQEPLVCCHLYPVIEECVDIIENNTVVAFRLVQHALLLLPCWNRRQLQLLVRFMKNVAKNSSLRISNDLSNRDLVIHSFFRVITRKEKHTLTTPFNEGIGMRFTAFLMDSYDENFSTPQGLRVQVDHKLAVIHGSLPFGRPLVTGKRPGSADESKRRQQFYCKQITKQEYEKEAVDFSNNAIRDLLQLTLNDTTLSAKERSKRLKQFEKAYPDIYAEIVPTMTHDNNMSICSSDSQRVTRGFRLARKPSFMREKMV